MMLEARLSQLLSPLLAGRLYPDTAPDQPTYPFATYQQVGGDSKWNLEGGTGSHRNARIQFNVWAKSRSQANTLAVQIESTLSVSELIAEPFGAFTALHDDVLKVYGTRQDFGFWHENT